MVSTKYKHKFTNTLLDPIEREACVCGEGGVIVNSPPWEEPREALAYQGTPYSYHHNLALPIPTRTHHSCQALQFCANQSQDQTSYGVCTTQTRRKSINEILTDWMFV